MNTVFVFTTSYHPFLGGAEVAIEEITKRLARDFQFFIITARQDRKLSHRELRPEGTVLRIGIGSALFDKWILAFLGGPIVWWKLTFGEWHDIYKQRKIVLFGIDISQGTLAATMVSLLLPHIPFILNLQYGYGEDRLAKGRGGAIKYAFQRMLARADFVTAISTYLLKLARENPYCYRDSAAIIPNGVDIERFSAKEAKKPHTHPTVITVSRLVHKNGVDTLIDAIDIIKKKNSDIQCHILGDGPEREALEKQVAEKGLRNNIFFFGGVLPSEVPRYLHNADIFVRASRSEGMGNAFVEALAAGLPIIGTPVGGIFDIIEDGKTGLFANVDQADDLAEKIMTLLSKHMLAQSIIENGSAMVRERFSWSSIAETYKHVFEIISSASRVVVAAPLFPPDVGGPATYVYALREDLWKQKILLKIAYFGDVRHFPKVIRHSIYFLQICGKARGRNMIFAQDPVSTGFSAMLAAKLLRKKFLLKVVGDYAWEQWQQKNKNLKIKNQNDNVKFQNPEAFQNKQYDFITEIRRFIERLVAVSADIVVVPSNYLKKIVTLWDVFAEKIVVIPNAFDIPEAINTKESAREKFQLSGTVIVSAGRLVPWKGFEKLIEMMPRIIEKKPDAKLYIIGEGPEWKNLELLIVRHSLQSCVVFCGAVPHNALLSYFRAGDLFILNTGYEGLSHVLLEAMAMEIPIITTNVCGNPELIENGVEGILVDYNDGEGILNAVVTLLQNKDLLEKMIVCAKAKVRQFSRERMINRTKEILLS